MKNVLPIILLAFILLCPVVSNMAQKGAEQQKQTLSGSPRSPDDDNQAQSPNSSEEPSTSAQEAQKTGRSKVSIDPTSSRNDKGGAKSPANSGPGSPTNDLDVKVAPSNQQPLTEIYRVGPGDVLDVRLLNSTSSRSTLFTVFGAGLIDLPVAGGPISVAGMTPEEIQTHIAAELKRRAIEEGAQIAVGVRQYASHAVVVTGLVNNPGTKFLRREAVPLYVILAEAQLRPDAGRLFLMHSGSPGQNLDLSDPLTLNFNVVSGDVVTVSGRPQEFYYIAGRINYPGQKIFQPGITLLQAVLAAGGLVRQNDNSIEVSREGSEGRLITTRFNIKGIKSGKVEDPKLQPGDRIEVLH